MPFPRMPPLLRAKKAAGHKDSLGETTPKAEREHFLLLVEGLWPRGSMPRKKVGVSCARLWRDIHRPPLLLFIRRGVHRRGTGFSCVCMYSAHQAFWRLTVLVDRARLSLCPVPRPCAMKVLARIAQERKKLAASEAAYEAAQLTPGADAAAATASGLPGGLPDGLPGRGASAKAAAAAADGGGGADDDRILAPVLGTHFPRMPFPLAGGLKTGAKLELPHFDAALSERL